MRTNVLKRKKKCICVKHFRWQTSKQGSKQQGVEVNKRIMAGRRGELSAPLITRLETPITLRQGGERRGGRGVGVVWDEGSVVGQCGCGVNKRRVACKVWVQRMVGEVSSKRHCGEEQNMEWLESGW